MVCARALPKYEQNNPGRNAGAHHVGGYFMAGESPIKSNLLRGKPFGGQEVHACGLCEADVSVYARAEVSESARLAACNAGPPPYVGGWQKARLHSHRV